MNLMKELNWYISEKLHINKDTKYKESTLDKYNVGDKCLFVTYIASSLGSPGFNLIDAVQIVKNNGKSFNCKYLTKYGVINPRSTHGCNFYYAEQNIGKYSKFLLTLIRKGRLGLLIPENECLKYLECIEKNKNRLGFYKASNNEIDKIDTTDSLVAELYDGAKRMTWANCTGINKVHLNKLKEIFNETN